MHFMFISFNGFSYCSLVILGTDNVIHYLDMNMTLFYKF